MMKFTLDEIGENVPDPNTFQERIVPPPEPAIWEKILNAPTGEGELIEYYHHPLNFNFSEPLARILRGLTGIIGNLNLALADILVGLLQFVFEQRKSPPGPPAS